MAAELVRQARDRGLSWIGPDELLKQLTKTVIETALQEEITEHLGYEKHDPAGAETGNIRNGTRVKSGLRAVASRSSSPAPSPCSDGNRKSRQVTDASRQVRHMPAVDADTHACDLFNLRALYRRTASPCARF